MLLAPKAHEGAVGGEASVIGESLESCRLKTRENLLGLEMILLKSRTKRINSKHHRSEDIESDWNW